MRKREISGANLPHDYTEAVKKTKNGIGLLLHSSCNNMLSVYLGGGKESCKVCKRECGHCLSITVACVHMCRLK